MSASVYIVVHLKSKVHDGQKEVFYRNFTNADEANEYAQQVSVEHMVESFVMEEKTLDDGRFEYFQRDSFKIALQS